MNVKWRITFIQETKTRHQTIGSRVSSTELELCIWAQHWSLMSSIELELCSWAQHWSAYVLYRTGAVQLSPTLVALCAPLNWSCAVEPNIDPLMCSTELELCSWAQHWSPYVLHWTGAVQLSPTLVALSVPQNWSCAVEPNIDPLMCSTELELCSWAQHWSPYVLHWTGAVQLSPTLVALSVPQNWSCAVELNIGQVVCPTKPAPCDRLRIHLFY